MKGSITLRSNRRNPYWYVNWPHKGKVYKISHYTGESEPMYQRHPDKTRDIGYKKAEKLLALMQGDEERGVLRIEQYIGKPVSDTVQYLEQWLEARSKSLTPGGYIKYRTAVKNYLVPYFTEHPIKLDEIQYDNLIQLMNSISGSGKHKKNVMDTFKCCLRFAWKANRIISVPPFPEAKLYHIMKKPPEWLPKKRFLNVLQHIAPEHQPFFMWLYFHLRRPGEAINLRKIDYDKDQDVFIVRRGVSNGVLVDYPKDEDWHIVPCHSEFKKYMKAMPPSFGDFYFTCSESKSEGKRYTGKLYRKYWYEACEKAGEDIDVYRGTKTSRASQMVNEEGVSISDLQIAGDWACMSSVTAYAKANVARRREILEGKVIPLRKENGGRVAEDSEASN